MSKKNKTVDTLETKVKEAMVEAEQRFNNLLKTKQELVQRAQAVDQELLRIQGEYRQLQNLIGGDDGSSTGTA